jgi:hypothetical protein
MASFAERMMGAAKLNVRTFEEVEADPTALRQAMGVVALSSIATGIGAVGLKGGPGLVGGIVGGLLGWAIWAWLTYFIGTRILPAPQTHADWGQLARTTGFAAAPGIIRAVGVVPGLTTLVFAIANLWMLAAFVVAVRQALDYTSTWRAIGVCLIGWLVNAVVLALAWFVLPG